MEFLSTTTYVGIICVLVLIGILQNMRDMGSDNTKRNKWMFPRVVTSIIIVIVCCLQSLALFNVVTFELGITSEPVVYDEAAVWFDSLPIEYTQGIAEVKKITKEQNRFFYFILQLNRDGMMIGSYSALSKQIFMLEDDYDLLLHEVGHHIYATKLNDSMKALWEDLFAITDIFIDGHSAENVDEFFAEGFSCYYNTNRTTDYYYTTSYTMFNETDKKSTYVVFDDYIPCYEIMDDRYYTLMDTSIKQVQKPKDI